MDFGDAGVTAKFQNQSFEVAWFSVRRKVGAQYVGEVTWNPASENLDASGGMPSAAPGGRPKDGRSFLQRGIGV